jgi:hypothetical protein
MAPRKIVSTLKGVFVSAVKEVEQQANVLGFIFSIFSIINMEEYLQHVGQIPTSIFPATFISNSAWSGENFSEKEKYLLPSNKMFNKVYF